jgi:hypothetical protein
MSKDAINSNKLNICPIFYAKFLKIILVSKFNASFVFQPKLLESIKLSKETCNYNLQLGAITITCTIANVMFAWFFHVLKL